MRTRHDKNLERHDSLIDVVENELIKRGYQTIYRNTKYSGSYHCGEIDLWAKKDSYILSFEMKASNTYKNRKKAKSQLERAEMNCFPFNRVFSFYVSDYKNPQIEWIKKIKINNTY